MKKILVIQTAFIGDAVLATGIIEKLHYFFPETAIDLLVRKGNEQLFIDHPFLNEVLTWDKKIKKYRHLLQLLKIIRSRRYDKAINIQRYAASGFLTAFSKAGETIGFEKNPFSFLFDKKISHRFGNNDNAVHEIQRNNELIRELTDHVPMKPKLYPSIQDFEKVKPYKHVPYICISPASVWFTKQYPGEKWISFINNIPEPFNIFLLGAPGDNKLCEEIKSSTRNALVINLCGQLSFLESAALMQDAAMNYVNDSAPLHFASAVNAPVTAVYCSTIPAFGYGPLSVKSFIAETEELLSCRPCGLHGYKACPEKHFKCAFTIKDEQLLQTIPV